MPDNFVTIGRLRATTIARIPVGLSSEVVRRVRDEIVRRYPGATRTAAVFEQWNGGVVFMAEFSKPLPPGCIEGEFQVVDTRPLAAELAPPRSST